MIVYDAGLTFWRFATVTFSVAYVAVVVFVSSRLDGGLSNGLASLGALAVPGLVVGLTFALLPFVRATLVGSELRLEGVIRVRSVPVQDLVSFRSGFPVDTFARLTATEGRRYFLVHVKGLLAFADACHARNERVQVADDWMTRRIESSFGVSHTTFK